MILQVKNIIKEFIQTKGLFGIRPVTIRALDDVSFAVDEFSTLGIVGESGSGKTTLAKIILKLTLPTKGEIFFNPKIISNFRKDVQIVFQNPYNSLNPKMCISKILAEPLCIHRVVSPRLYRQRSRELLNMVGLDEAALDRYPAQFSGGQRQRICIARALASEPKLIVLDEPISSLDLTVQAQMLDLFLELKKKFRLTYIFISHNLAIIKHIANFVLVMYKGKIIEQGPVENIFNQPLHNYTKSLLWAAKER